MAASRLATVLLLGVVAACSGSSATPSPGSTATVSPPVTPTPTAAITDAPTGAPTSTTAPPTATLPPPPVPSPPAELQEGLGWSATEVPQVGELCCWQLASADAGFLIFAGNADAGPLLLTSTNGTTWRVIDGLVWPGGLIGRISDWDGAFLAAGAGGTADAPRLAVWQSPDGRTWLPLADLALPKSAHTQGQLNIRTAFATEDKITVVGEIWPETCQEGCDGPLAVRQWTSTDNGGSWRSANLDAEIYNHDPPIELDSASVRMSRYWDAIEIRLDGQDWQTAWLPEPGHFAQPSQVRLTTLGVLAVGYLGDEVGGLVLNSTDGIAWTQSVGWPDLDAAGGLRDVAQFGSRLVAIGYAYDSAGHVRAYVLVSPALG